MNEPILLRRLPLTASHSPTGKTRHLFGDKVLPAPAELRIVRYRDDPGYYLFYCDISGKEITDTYHESLAKAMAQAEFEFQTKEGDWEIVSSG
jgi:hypothetical protein